MGSQDSTSNSAPVSAAQRLETYGAGVGAMSGYTDPDRRPNETVEAWQGRIKAAEMAKNPEMGGDYVAPTYERMGEGDYNTVREGLNAGTNRQQTLALKANDQALSDRGIYTSLNALRSNDTTRETYAPQFAANDATVMQMKAQDIAGANAAAQDAAKQKYEASWRPADYKAGLWNGTGGVVSSGTSGGWSI